MRIKLKDICTKITDGSHFSPIDTKNGYPMLSIQDMLTNGFDYSKCKHISKSDYDSLVKNGCKPEKSDILIAKDGSYLKEIFVVKEDKEEVVLSSIAILRPNTQIVNPHFLKYYLSTESIKDEVARKYVSGSVLKRIILKNFENIEIDLPDHKIQDKIAEILSGIDEQINRNNEVVKRLQVLAQTTYSRWFNQFEFPNKDGLPYKSSGGKMVWNDELKREIPEDWSVKTLGDLLTKNTEKLQDYNDVPTIDLSVMKADNIALGELNTGNNFSSNLFVMHKGDLLFGSIRPYLHKAGIAPCDGAFAGTVHSYRPVNDIDYNICLSALTNNDIFSFAVKNAKGTKMPVIASDDLLQYKIPYNESISKQFTKLLDIKNIVCNCMMQNNMLIQLKNSILPLLINGQLNI